MHRGRCRSWADVDRVADRRGHRGGGRRRRPRRARRRRPDPPDPAARRRCRRRSTGPTSPAPTRRGSSSCSRRRRATRAPTWRRKAEVLASDDVAVAEVEYAAGARPPRALPASTACRCCSSPTPRRRPPQRPRPGDRHRPVGRRRRRPRGLSRKRELRRRIRRRVSSHFRARRTTSSTRRRRSAGRLVGVPAEVEQLPAARCRGDVAVLVERFGDRPEVEPAAVRLEPELHRRDGDVRRRPRWPSAADDRVLRQHERRQARRVDAATEQLLEPGVGTRPSVGIASSSRSSVPVPDCPGRCSRSAVARSASRSTCRGARRSERPAALGDDRARRIRGRRASAPTVVHRRPSTVVTSHGSSGVT